MGELKSFLTPLKAVLVFLLGALLVIGTGGYNALTAKADSLDGWEINPGFSSGATITGGETQQLTIVYPANVGANYEARIKIPEGVTFPNSVPSGNEAISSIAIDGDYLVLTFKNQSTNASGVVGFTYKVPEPESGSSKTSMAWELNGTPYTFQVTVLEPGDEPLNGAISNSVSKQANDAYPWGINNKISIKDGVVTVDPSVANVELSYTVTVNSADARNGATISDTLDSMLSYEASSFSAVESWWDEDGLNKQTKSLDVTPTISGNSFTYSGVDLHANSKLVITYKAKIAADQVDDLQAALQAKLDQLGGADADPGTTVDQLLKNTATVTGEAPASATVHVSQSVPQPEPDPTPNVGGAFSKSATPQSSEIELENDGTTLKTPVKVEYSLKADLTQWADFAETENALATNVVIVDDLASSGTQNIFWLDEAPTVTGTGLTGLTAAPANTSVDDMSGDAFVGMYMFDGPKLIVNVGKDVTTNVTVKATAEIRNVDGVNVTENPTAYIEKQFNGPKNTATFNYNGTSTQREVSHTLTVPADTSGGVNDPQLFSKTAKDVSVTPGEVAQVPFTFSKNAWNDGAYLPHSHIVDIIDHSVLDVTAANLDDIRETITGTYGNQVTLTPDFFELTLDDDQNLVITPVDDFESKIPEWMVGQSVPFTLTVTIPTHVIQGKTTLDVTNSARLYGSDAEEGGWTSQVSPQATSFGDEREVKKSIYAGDDAWTDNFRVELDENGNLVQDEFIYRIEVIGHGAYTNLSIPVIDDVLPDNLEFLGFVTDPDADGVAQASGTESLSGPGNLEATWDEDAHTLKVLQKSGTKFSNSAPSIIMFKVKMTDFTPDVPVVNVAENSSTTITPSEGYPLQIQKKDTTNASTVISDANARFTVRGPGADGPVITNQAYVKDGLIVVGSEGKSVIVDKPGDYYVTETKAPAGYQLETDPIVVSVDANGDSDAATFYDEPGTSEPQAKTYAVGDYVWVDANKDGVQDSSEEPLAGVTVNLLKKNAEGEFVQVATDTTDENGRYLFDNLEAGDYQVQFVLTEAQAEQYEFTTYMADGKAAGSNSDAGSDGKSEVFSLGDGTVTKQYYAQEFSATEGIDPTWDAGVVVKEAPQAKTYAVGDYVWVDANKDGVQDSSEEPLAGVTVNLLKKNAEGEFVQVATDTTDENGRYLFDNLEAGDYQVQFVLTDEQAAKYAFTQNVAGDSSKDNSDGLVTSDAKVAVTDEFSLGEDSVLSSSEEYTDQEFTATQGIDPTWDAGVVVKSVSVGDLVWFDEDRDGVQDAGEPGIPDVTLTISRTDGQPVVDVNGDPVTTTTTDEDGVYSFDDLPVLPDGVNYVVTVTDPDGYVPTVANAGDDTTVDSSTGSATAKDLPNDGDRDPSLDFGYVKKTYAVGDVVWVDTNKDGVQGESEFLEGVTVNLFKQGADGFVQVTTTTTNSQGRYLFDELEAGTYQVQFVLTESQAAKYTFTTYMADGKAAGSNSDAGADGKSAAFELGDGTVTKQYDAQEFTATQGIDPTWDAGVILATTENGGHTPNPNDESEGGDTPEPSDNGEGVNNGDDSGEGEGGEVSEEDAPGTLAKTGLGENAALVGGLLILAGAATMLARRRRS